MASFFQSPPTSHNSYAPLPQLTSLMPTHGGYIPDDLSTSMRNLSFNQGVTPHDRRDQDMRMQWEMEQERGHRAQREMEYQREQEENLRRQKEEYERQQRSAWEREREIERQKEREKERRQQQEREVTQLPQHVHRPAVNPPYSPYDGGSGPRYTDQPNLISFKNGKGKSSSASSSSSSSGSKGSSGSGDTPKEKKEKKRPGDRPQLATVPGAIQPANALGAELCLPYVMFDHQLKAGAWLRNRFWPRATRGTSNLPPDDQIEDQYKTGAILHLDPGLGKTLTSLVAALDDRAWQLANGRAVGPVLVVTPLNVFLTWYLHLT